MDLPALNLAQCSTLEFHEPDFERFPALSLAFQAIKQGGVLPAVLNAANEVAVAAFLDGAISFLDIAATVATVMGEVSSGSEDSIDEILQADARAREVAGIIIGSN
jgi:1-deoxy-D-xylulose-5-phosphate reductoisomerase